MSVEGALRPTKNFIDHFFSVMSNSDNILEGTFWGAWLGMSVKNLNDSISRRKELDFLPESDVQKADKIWEANKKIILDSVSAISGSSIIFSWMHQVSLIALGSFAPFVHSMSFGGSSLVSSVNAWDTAKEINQGIEAYYREKDPHKRDAIALLQLHNMLKLAFSVCITAWGILGAIHAIIGGAELFVVVDLLFFYSAMFFLTGLAAIIFAPPPLTQSVHEN